MPTIVAPTLAPLDVCNFFITFFAVLSELFSFLLLLLLLIRLFSYLRIYVICFQRHGGIMTCEDGRVPFSFFYVLEKKAASVRGISRRM